MCDMSNQRACQVWYVGDNCDLDIKCELIIVDGCCQQGKKYINLIFGIQKTSF